MAWLLVGLGNPGKRYALTRHNMGFLVMDRCAQMEGIVLNERRGRALIGRGSIGNDEVVMAKPMTYMNRSGIAVCKLLEELEISLDNLVVIHDDLDLAFGRIRIKRKGGHGGHKGVQSIIERLGRDDFLRLKVGIGRPPRPEQDVMYVLSPFSYQEIPLLRESVDKATEAIRTILIYGETMAMNMYHSSYL